MIIRLQEQRQVRIGFATLVFGYAAANHTDKLPLALRVSKAPEIFMAGFPLSAVLRPD